MIRNLFVLAIGFILVGGWVSPAKANHRESVHCDQPVGKRCQIVLFRNGDGGQKGVSQFQLEGGASYSIMVADDEWYSYCAVPEGASFSEATCRRRDTTRD